MIQTHTAQEHKAAIRERRFLGKSGETDAIIDKLNPESQAGLRQYSLERMTGYGIDYADAIELRARILSGEEWCEAATSLAQDILDAAERVDPPASTVTRRTLFHRASALLRMSQALMLEDTPERRSIVRRSVEAYAKAAGLGLVREHVHIETLEGVLSGWFVGTGAEPPAGIAIVIGGVEGWAMDFDIIGDTLAARGVATLLLDAPGQGESRILNQHFLTENWLVCFRSAIDWCENRLPGLPIGLVGNSLGGALTVAVANQDRRVAACVNNGGIMKPSMARMAGATFFRKMIAFTGLEGDDLENRAAAIWDHVQPLAPGPNADYPLLVVQGGHDPLVNDDHARLFMQSTPTSRKQMEYFSDGIHSLYNHLADREIVVGDWMRARLLEAAHSPALPLEGKGQ